MGYTKSFIPPKVTVPSNVFNRIRIYCILLFASLVAFHHRRSQIIWMNGSPTQTTNMTCSGGLCGTPQRHKNDSESSGNSSQTSTGKDIQFVNQTNQYHPLHGYGYLSSQQPFPDTPQLYQHFLCNITHNSQPTTCARQWYESYGLQWQGYNLHQGGYGGSQMFPPLQIPGQDVSSPDAPRVPPEPQKHNAVNYLTSCTPKLPPDHPFGTGRRPLISLPTKRFQPPAELWNTDVARITTLSPLLEMSYDDHDADVESNDSFD